MSGTLTLTPGQVFTGSSSLGSGDTGMIALTQVGTVTFDTSTSPATIGNITITKDAEASTLSEAGLFIESVVITSVTPNSTVVLSSKDLPPGTTVPAGFTLPQNVVGTTLGVSVITNSGTFDGTAGVYGTDGPLVLVAVQSINVFGFNVNAGAAILSLGTQATGSVAASFTPAFTSGTGTGTTTITASTPDSVVAIPSGNSLVFVTVPDTLNQASGASTIISNAGAMTVNATGGSQVIFDSKGGSLINEAPSSEYVSGPSGLASTINGATGGTDTIFALSAAQINDSGAASELFLGGAGAVTMAAAIDATLYAGSGGGTYTPGSGSFFLFGGGGTDNIVGGTASLTVWGNTNERLTAASTHGGGIFIAFGDNDSIDASAAGGGNSFIVVNESVTLPGGTFSGNTTLVGSSAGSDTFAIFSEGAAPPAHTITIDNWQASDTLFLGGYSTADLQAANAALAGAAAGAGASFTLSDQTTIAFVGAHPTTAA